MAGGIADHVEDAFKWLLQQYGLPGFYIAALHYALNTVWKDNKDLRARLDRLTDRFVVRDAITATKPENLP